jgi:hypothetical protein
VGNGVKDEPLKGFSPVNRAETGNKAYNPRSYMIILIKMMTMMITITLIII